MLACAPTARSLNRSVTVTVTNVKGKQRRFGRVTGRKRISTHRWYGFTTMQGRVARRIVQEVVDAVGAGARGAGAGMTWLVPTSA